MGETELTTASSSEPKTSEVAQTKVVADAEIFQNLLESNERGLNPDVEEKQEQKSEVSGDEEPVEEETEEESSEAVAEETEEDSQVSEDSENEESEEATQEEESETESEEKVLSQSKTEKSKGKLLKRVDKLTARLKGQQEENERLREKLQDTLESGSQEVSLGERSDNPLSEVKTEQDLEKQKRTAREIKRWAARVIRKGDDPEDVVAEVEGRSYTLKQAQDILDRAEDHLDIHIPQQAKVLQQRVKVKKESVQWDQQAEKDFTFLGELESDKASKFKEALRHPSFKMISEMIPSGKYLLAAAFDRISDLEKTRANGKVKKVLTSKKPTSSTPLSQSSPSKKRLAGGDSVSAKKTFNTLWEKAVKTQNEADFIRAQAFANENNI